MKVLSVFGTRPEAIKMAPVVKALAEHPGVESRVCVTAQHRDMLDQVLSLFGIVPDYDLDVMRPSQTPTQVAVAVMAGLEPIIAREGPDWVLVQGDTTTATAASIGSFYGRARVGHIEAGLRTHSRYHPFPEEVNRRLAAVTADLHFAPTNRARQNLVLEGVVDQRILVTGNTVIDAMLQVANMPYRAPDGLIPQLPPGGRMILATSHRRENFGRPLHEICGALFDLAEAHRDDLEVVFSVHPNPQVQAAVHSLLGGQPNVRLLPPVDYLPFVHLLKRADVVLTDSGGIQEEAPSLGKPVLVLREITERPEAVEAGAVQVVGTSRRRIVEAAERLLGDRARYDEMARATNPYGDGRATERIVVALLEANDHLPSVLDFSRSARELGMRLEGARLTVKPFRPSIGESREQESIATAG